MEIQLLGPVGLLVEGRRVELGSDRERTVLAALALDTGRPVALDTLMDRLWDGDPPPGARGTVHSYISKVRRRLRQDTSARGDRTPLITARAHSYTLETARESVDWHRFQRLVMHARTTAADGDDDERTAALLQDAERLWRGEALTGLPGSWAETVRRSLTEHRLAATVSRVAAVLRLGRFTEVGGELSDLVDRYPGHETLAGQLMLAHYGSGRYTDALRVHEETRRLLLRQYASRPGAELTRIHRGILDRAPAADLTRGTPTAARTAPAGPRPATTPATAASPAARPAPPAPRNLPHQPPLVGRQAELRALSAALDSPASAQGAVISLESVSTVSGMAGVGKTALAVDGAHRLAGRFPAAQLYLDLRGHSPAGEPLSPGAALATLLRLLGAPAETIPVELEGRIALWRTLLADRRAVVVLDDAVSTDQIRPLLPGPSPTLTIITSRRRLTGLPHARHIPLDVLSTEDAIALFRAFAGAERAQDDAEAARIVQLCGRLPLAIELVASRFGAHPSWTLGTLADRLTRAEGRLAEIRDVDREMGRAFDLTYQTLTPDERVAFRRLSLHPGPDITSEAAAAALGLPRPAAERVLESLLACHLLREPEPDRYQYHDLLREYGHSRSCAEDDEHERTAVLRRLTDFWLDAADRADRLGYPRRIRPPAPPCRSGSEPPHWADARGARAWLGAERDNLLAAQECARDQGWSETAARLAYAVAGYLDTECHWYDVRSVLEQATDHWSRTGETAALCRALLYLSAAYAHTGAYPEAAGTGGRALDLARRTGDTEAEAEILRTLGTLNWHMGDHRAALVLFQKSFALKAVRGDAWDKARGYNNIAITLNFLGEHDRAREHYEKAIEGFLEAGDHASLGRTLNNLGDLLQRRGDLEAARGSLEKAIGFLERSGNRYDRATAWGTLADVLTQSGDTDGAFPLYRQTLTDFQVLGDRKSQADTLIGLGDAHRRAGDTDEAVQRLLEALEIARSIGAAHQETHALRCLGEAHLAAGRPEAAAEHLRAALTLAGRTHDVDEELASRRALAEVAKASGESGTSS